MVHARACRSAPRLAVLPSLTTLPQREVRAALEAACTDERVVARQMFEDLAMLATPQGREKLWQLAPSWAWVWFAEAVDPASWVRAVRWAQQIAARRQDPAPLAALLLGFAARRGEAEARARLDAAR